MSPCRAAALVSVLALGLTSCTDGGPPGGDEAPTTVDTVVPAAFGWTIEGVTSYAVVPQYRYNFTVSQPREQLDFATASEQEISERAPDGKAFIAVSWDGEPTNGLGWILAFRDDSRVPSPELTVTVDGESFPLGPIDEPGESDGAYLVVPEGSDDVVLEVDYDGFVQTIDDPYSPTGKRALGPAGPSPGLLYGEDPHLQTIQSSGRELRAGGDRVEVGFTGTYAQCSVLPWVSEVGWAQPGRAWRVCEVSTNDSFRENVARSSTVVSIDGVEPRPFPLDGATGVGEQDDGRWRARLVFDVSETDPGDELRIQRDYLVGTEDARLLGKDTERIDLIG